MDTPSEAQPEHSQWHGFRLWLIVLIFASCIYLCTAAPGLLWGDSVDAQLRVFQADWFGDSGLGVCRTHMPYYILAIGCRTITGWPATWSATFISALAGAITIANMALLLSQFVHKKTSILSVIILLTLSHTIWQMSTGAEVVTTFTMCLSLEILLVVKYIRTGNAAFLVGLGFMNGLGWSVHNFAMLIWPAYFLTIIVYRKSIPRPSIRWISLACLAWCVGVLPLAIATIHEYTTIHSVTDTVRSVLTGKNPNPYATGLNLSLKTLIKQVGFLGINFPTPLVLLIPYGWWAMRSRTRPSAWTFLTLATAVHLIFAVRYNVPDQITFMIPSYLFFMIFLAVGIDQLLERFASKTLAATILLASLPAPLVYHLTPGIVARIPQTQSFFPKHHTPNRPRYEWFIQPWRTGYTGAEEYSRAILEYLPENSLVYSRTTIRTAVEYMLITEIDRPDIQIPRKSVMRDGATEPSPEVQALMESNKLFVAGTDSSSNPDWFNANPDKYQHVPVTDLPEKYLYRIEPVEAPTP